MNTTNVNPNEEMKMTYTSVLTKDGKPLISLLFERGNDSCEASVPTCCVTKNDGFTKEEVEALEEYLTMNKAHIIEHAKEISGFLRIFSGK